ncbi:MAG TPA: hypothetical protein VFK80_05150 [Limnochordia bacterium]|nr:hypothetical protein [Limnochordia bacterium]
MLFDKAALWHLSRWAGTVVFFVAAVWLLAFAPIRDAAGIDPKAIAAQVAGMSPDSTAAAINASLSQIAAQLQHDQLVAQARWGLGVAIMGLSLLIRPLRPRSAPSRQRAQAEESRV